MNPTAKKIIAALLIILFGALVYMAWTVVTYLLISIVFGLAIRPLLHLLDKVKIGKFHINKTLSALIGLVTIYVIIGGFFYLFVPKLVKEIKFFTELDVEKVYHNLEGPLLRLELWADKYNIRAHEFKSNREYVEERLLGVVNIEDVTGLFSSLVSSLGNIFIAIFSISFITFFILRERESIHQLLMAMASDNNREKVAHVIFKTKKSLSRYFLGLFIQISLITLIVSTSLGFLGVKNAFLIGFFAGIINVIPYLGPIIGASFGILLALTGTLGAGIEVEFTSFIIQILLVFGSMQLMDNFIFQPFIFSNSVNAHPLEIFLVIITAGTILGITGMVIAVPTYSFLRIVAREFLSEFRIIAVLTEKV